MEKEFAERLEDLIDEEVKKGGSLNDVLGDLELKCQALREQLAEDEDDG